jgi:hypothetical protein
MAAFPNMTPVRPGDRLSIPELTGGSQDEGEWLKETAEAVKETKYLTDKMDYSVKGTPESGKDGSKLPEGTETRSRKTENSVEDAEHSPEETENSVKETGNSVKEAAELPQETASLTDRLSNLTGKFADLDAAPANSSGETLRKDQVKLAFEDAVA